MVLEASYEATLWSAVIHALKHKNDPRARKVFLTALGGGVFGNDMDWIANAIDKAC
jgi:O-acetyl-ADP-ribose deacetylase (regulator of RNase III)